MLTTNKDLREILSLAITKGWSFKRSGKGHIKGRSTSGKTVTISGTPSDYRVLLNIRRDLGIKR